MRGTVMTRRPREAVRPRIRLVDASRMLKCNLAGFSHPPAIILCISILQQLHELGVRTVKPYPYSQFSNMDV